MSKDNPTPPQPPEMPKPDAKYLRGYYEIEDFKEYACWCVNTGTTSIERAYSELSRVAQQQHERAEKAEAECVANHKAYADLSARLAEKTMENARLREALFDTELDLYDTDEINPSNYTHEQVCELNDKVIEAYLRLKKFNDGIKQRSPTPEATPHEEAGEATDE